MDEKFKITMANLERHGIDAYYLEHSGDVVPFIETLVPKNSTVSCGGSETLKQTGVINLLSDGDYEYFDRSGLEGNELRQCYLKALGCDFYFCSSNAVTEDGELFNVDGNSNRVACIVFGPANVIMIVGKNKIVKDIDEAILHVKKTAAPLNAKRLNCNTPCTKTGICANMDCRKDFASGCSSLERICCNYVVSSHQRIEGRIKVIIVNEDLGY